jgi:hypothetical protein
MQRMRDTTGRKMTAIKRPVIGVNPSIQEPWSEENKKSEVVFSVQHQE